MLAKIPYFTELSQISFGINKPLAYTDKQSCNQQ